MTKGYVKFTKLRAFDAIFDIHMRQSDDAMPPEVIETEDARMLVAKANGHTLVASSCKDDLSDLPILSSDDRADELARKTTASLINVLKEIRTEGEAKFVWNVMKTTFPAVEQGRRLGKDVTTGQIAVGVGWKVEGQKAKAKPKSKAKGTKKSG